jgi:hypothetical protein
MGHPTSEKLEAPITPASGAVSFSLQCLFASEKWLLP